MKRSDARKHLESAISRAKKMPVDSSENEIHQAMFGETPQDGFRLVVHRNGDVTSKTYVDCMAGHVGSDIFLHGGDHIRAQISPALHTYRLTVNPFIYLAEMAVTCPFKVRVSQGGEVILLNLYEYVEMVHSACRKRRVMNKVSIYQQFFKFLFTNPSVRTWLCREMVWGTASEIFDNEFMQKHMPFGMRLNFDDNCAPDFILYLYSPNHGSELELPGEIRQAFRRINDKCLVIVKETAVMIHTSNMLEPIPDSMVCTSRVDTFRDRIAVFCGLK